MKPLDQPPAGAAGGLRAIAQITFRVAPEFLLNVKVRRNIATKLTARRLSDL